MVKHQTFQRLWLLFLSATLLLSVTACSKEEELHKSGTLTLNGKSVRTDWVMRINDQEIGADEYRYFFMNLVADTLEQQGADFAWDEESAKQLKEQTLEYIALNHALLDYAAGYGITLDQPEAETYARELEEETRKEFGTEKEFLQSLDYNYFTPAYFREAMRITYVQDMLAEKVFSADGEHNYDLQSFLKIMEEEYRCVRYLELNYNGDNQASVTALARALEEQIRSGEKDFADLVNTYSEDSRMLNNPDGVYLNRDTMGEVLWEAVNGLSENEMSGVLDTGWACYIVMRLKPSNAYIEEHFKTLLEDYQETLLSRFLKEIISEYTFTYHEIYDRISVFSME